MGGDLLAALHELRDALTESGAPAREWQAVAAVLAACGQAGAVELWERWQGEAGR